MAPNSWAGSACLTQATGENPIPLKQEFKQFLHTIFIRINIWK